MGDGFKLVVRCARGDFRRWQSHVIETLAADRTIDLSLEIVSDVQPAPAGLETLFAFDRLFLRGAKETAADLVPFPTHIAAYDRRSGCDLAIDLTGHAQTANTHVTLLGFSCQGLPPLPGALSAILDNDVPVLSAVCQSGERTTAVAGWAVGVEDPVNALAGVAMVLGRLAHLVLTAVDHYRRNPETLDGAIYRAPGVDLSLPSKAPGRLAAPQLMARSLTQRINGRLQRLLKHRVDWRVIYRTRVATSLGRLPMDDRTPFTVLADDGQRFYADPFPVTVDGRSYLFVEDYAYAARKGVISVAEINTDGSLGAMRPALEQDCHLSYPNVFAHDSQVWMIPETAARKTIELWVADRFPDRWRLHGILVDGVEAADATVACIDGIWWMFASTRSRWASSWDTLDIWQASSLFGPWQKIANSPAAVDVGSARPAGRLIHQGGSWKRPVQDSRLRYGGGMALTRIDRLGPQGFTETVETRFPVSKPLMGLHTWNQSLTASGCFEAMDLFADPSAIGSSFSLF